MTVDLKYLIPFVLPFAILAALRGLCFVAGAEWDENGNAAEFSAILGLSLGFAIVGIMAFERITWPLRIGRRSHDPTT